MGIYGHGVDIALISRFKNTLAKYGDKFLKKALHPSEIKHFHSIVDVNDAKVRFVASRWALKEAIIKASGKRLLFPDMYTYKIDNDPRPKLCVENATLKYFEDNNLEAFISISHDGDYAMASVILQEKT